MKARPILMNSSMVQATLEGRKTNTRRIIKCEPWKDYHLEGGCSKFDWKFTEPVGFVDANDKYHFGSWAISPYISSVFIECPYGDVGDLLYVRENWALDSLGDCGGEIVYEADGLKKEILSQPYNGVWKRLGNKPSIHMPREISRLTLEIIDVRVEQLQDVSEEDAIAEGILVAPPLPQYLESVGDIYSSGIGDLDDFAAWTRNPIFAFRHLWESINGQDSWETNPWVWVVEFKVHHCNIDNFIKHIEG